MIIIWMIIGGALLQKMALLREVRQPRQGAEHTAHTQNCNIHIHPDPKPWQENKAALGGSISFQRRLTVPRPCYDLNWLSQLKIPSKLSLQPGLTAAGQEGSKAQCQCCKTSYLCCSGCTRAHNKRYSLKHTLNSPLINTNISSAFTQWQQD